MSYSRPHHEGAGDNGHTSRMEFVMRRHSRSRGASRDRTAEDRQRSPTPISYRHVTSATQPRVRRPSPGGRPSQSSGRIDNTAERHASSSSSSHQRYQNVTPSPNPQVCHEHFYQSQTRSSPPRPSAEATDDDLYRYFKNAPASFHLSDNPKQAIIFNMAEWLVRVRRVDENDAGILARLAVEERWEEDRNDGGSRTGKNLGPQVQNTHVRREASSTGRGRSRDRRVHWEDQERPNVQLSAGELIPTRNTETELTPYSSSAERQRSGRQRDSITGDHDRTVQNPWLASNSVARMNAPGNTPWTQVKYVPNLAPRGAFSVDPQHAVIQNLGDHLVQAIKIGLQARPDAEGPDLCLDARFQIPMSVAQSIVRGELGGDTADLLTTLTEINALVPNMDGTSLVVSERRYRDDENTYREVTMGTSRNVSLDENNRGRSRFPVPVRTPEEIAREEIMGWNSVRTPRNTWPY